MLGKGLVLALGDGSHAIMFMTCLGVVLCSSSSRSNCLSDSLVVLTITLVFEGRLRIMETLRPSIKVYLRWKALGGDQELAENRKGLKI
ncbi:hypothetical protein BO99DRAFT_82952 [Aspergillus violaceofuscus CBS 115571]|uniref:Uncharacterized protein n=1 Tax=Aspergillus violaceofuscus (strain CBS 115571) TaxID=1450538 RepID=A0A2V5IBA0_ASPV1|nr:hypothetical protein BO99DRAFT_82952 [Aspergillus violaceofuscus CBS 115571]